MNRILTIPAAACWLAAVLGGSCARVSAPATPSGPPWNVVLICLDTVRADHLGVYGHSRATTPALDELARRSLLFGDASATASWTKPSVPSFLTGTYPCQNGVYEGSAHGEKGDVTDLLPADALTLAEAFRERGYRTAAFVNNAQLRAGNGFEQGFDDYLEGTMGAREIRWRGLDWLDLPREQPFFLYLHFLDAHWPYACPEEWVTRFASKEATEKFTESRDLYDAINEGRYALTEQDRTTLEALYDGALAYLDSELGRLFAGLELRGLSENTVLCVVADHGEEFGEHGRVGHGHGLWENLLHVPWILHVPGRAAARDETPVSLIDLFPTLLSAAGLAPPAGLPGLDRLAHPDERAPILAEHKAPDRYFQSLRVGDEKLQRKFTWVDSDDPGARAVPIEMGAHWEAEFRVENGDFVATQMKPRPEAAPDSPELKGRIDALSPDGFRIAGIPVLCDASSVRQADKDTTGPELAVGQIVKVRGSFVGGVQHAQRIRFYPADELETLEIRGTVQGIEQSRGAGTVVLGGFVVRFTSSTALKDAKRAPATGTLSRLQIAELIDAGASSLADAQGYLTERDVYDLARDSHEFAPSPLAPGSPLDRRLDELGATLARKRLFGAQDQKQLDPEAVQALKDIGYGGDAR